MPKEKNNRCMWHFSTWSIRLNSERLPKGGWKSEEIKRVSLKIAATPATRLVLETKMFRDLLIGSFFCKLASTGPHQQISAASFVAF